MPNANAERRTQNAERQTPNAERRTQNAEFRLAVYHVKHVLSGSIALLNATPNVEFRSAVYHVKHVLPETCAFGFGRSAANMAGREIIHISDK